MARTKMNQRSASRVDVPMGATGGRTPPSKATVLLLLTCAISAIWAAAMLTSFGRVGYYYFWAYSEFYMGVLSLVALSITIMIGLVATDRLVLSIRQRVLLQSAHRTTGVIAVTALVIHVWTKLMESHIRAIDIVIPFLAPYNRVFIGLGTVSGLIMVLVMWTGLARARFIGRGKPWMWRSVHAVSYLMWPIALVHGLSAGRPAATWVIVSYVVCILFVLVGLAVRLSVSLNRRKDFASSSTGAIKPVGSLVPTNTPSPKKRASRRNPAPMDARVVADRGNAGVAVLDTWVPAAPPVSPAPAPAPRAAYDDEYRREARPARYAAEDDRSPRPGRYDAEPAPRSRRAEPAVRYDEPTRPTSRRAMEDDRYRYAEDDEPAPRRRRPAGDDYADESLTHARRVVEENRAARTTRYAEEDDEPRSRRARRYADEEEPAPRARRRVEDEPPRARRYAEDYEDMPRPRRSSEEARSAGAHSGEFLTGELRLDRTGDFRMDGGPASPRSRRYAEDGEPAPRSRRGTVDRADSGRHSRRSEFVDLAEPADPWGAADPNYMPPDETPTLVDIASRRARRANQQDAGRGQAGRGARRAKSRTDEELSDDQYWRQLRGEAQ
jgi:DMSO/TMAO reductase YedYZ heme-binding membrane subunit